MSKKLVELYEEEAVSQLKILNGEAIDSEAYKNALNANAKLAETLIELKKIELEQERLIHDHEEKIEAMTRDSVKAKSEHNDRRLGNILGFATSLLSLGGAAYAMVYSWAKESDGVMSWTAGKRATDYLMKPKK